MTGAGTVHLAASDHAVAAAVARCRVYREFANAFLHPDLGGAGRLDDGTWLARLNALARELPCEDPFTALGVPVLDGIAGLAQVYSSSFEVGQGAVSLHERSYGTRADTDKALFEDLFRFYEHFGLRFDGGLPELPDWLVVELEFMHYLCFLEAEAGDAPSRAALRRGERDFLVRHLQGFAAGLAARLGEARIPAYADAARLLEAFVRADGAWLTRAT